MSVGRGLQTPADCIAVEDAARLLFPHTVYKSYPPALLEKNRFDRMTQWLGRLTTVDLSGDDVKLLQSELVQLGLKITPD